MEDLPGKESKTFERYIARRLILFILVFSSVITLISTSARLYLEYRNDMESIENNMHQIELSYVDSIVNSLWVTDNELLKIQTDGILQLPDMQYLEIQSKTSQLLFSGTFKQSNVIRKEFKLSYLHNDKDVQLGTLIVAANLSEVYQRLLNKGFLILLSQLVNIFLVSVFVFFLFYYLVTRHLVTLAEYVSGLSFSQLEKRLVLNRNKRGRSKIDELDILVSGINEMRSNLQKDITERKKSEMEREALVKDLESKNAELEQFTYTVSHDLKSPLITIKGFLGMLASDAVKGNIDRMNSDINRISNAADKMQRLLDELLELSRIGRLVSQLGSILFAELAQKAVDSVAGRLLLKEVHTEINADAVEIKGDITRLLEVMENLVDNAAKFSSPEEQAKIVIGTRQEEDEIIFYVKDNGIGIKPQYREKIFGLFDKLDRNVEGTGIGLAIVKRVIEIHGGRIWVESAPEEKGSTFCFTIAEPS